MLKAAAENGGMRRVNERENVRWTNKKEAREGKSEEDEKKEKEARNGERERDEKEKKKETRKKKRKRREHRVSTALNRRCA